MRTLRVWAHRRMNICHGRDASNTPWSAIMKTSLLHLFSLKKKCFKGKPGRRVSLSGLPLIYKRFHCNLSINTCHCQHLFAERARPLFLLALWHSQGIAFTRCSTCTFNSHSTQVFTISLETYIQLFGSFKAPEVWNSAGRKVASNK